MLIYFGGSDSESYKVYAYKYDILNDNYTKLSDIPFEFYGGSAVAVEDNVYLIGSAKNDLTKMQLLKKIESQPYLINYGKLDDEGFRIAKSILCT